MFGAANLGPLTEIATDGPAKSRTEDILRWIWRAGLAIIVLLVLVLAWIVADGQLYRAGDDFGYNLGLAGGLLMVSLLLYPLRKRVRFMDKWGEMRWWFRYHMVAGIGGPALIIFHSTFRIGAMNSRVALYSMLLVALSGLVGRFLYRHIHRGMYGQHLTMSDVQEQLEFCTDNMGTIFAQYPQIQERLLLFRKYAFMDLKGFWPRFKRFVMLRIIARRLGARGCDQVKRAMKRAKREESLTKAQRILNYRLAKQKTEAFLDAVCDASQLNSWEKMFSYWHVIHIPFLYLLVISGVVHVIAVHMY